MLLRSTENSRHPPQHRPLHPVNQQQGFRQKALQSMDSQHPTSGTKTPATGSPHNPHHLDPAASTQQGPLPPSRYWAHHRHPLDFRQGHHRLLPGRHPPADPLHQLSPLDHQGLILALPLLHPQRQDQDHFLQNHHHQSLRLLNTVQIQELLEP